MNQQANKGRDFPALFHPAAQLLATLVLMFSLQQAAGWVSALACALTLMSPTARQTWFRLMRRNRWLLLVLLIVLAYGLPGEGLGGIDWLPSRNGLREGLMHALRLLSLLAILSWMLAYTPTQALLSGLWSLLAPLQQLGLNVERSISRLALVVSTLDTPAHPTRLSLSELETLLSRSDNHAGPESLTIQPAHWRVSDALFLVLISLFCYAILRH